MAGFILVSEEGSTNDRISKSHPISPFLRAEQSNSRGANENDIALTIVGHRAELLIEVNGGELLRALSSGDTVGVAVQVSVSEEAMREALAEVSE